MVSHLNIFADPGLISVKGTIGHYLSWKLRFATLPVTEIAKEGLKLSRFIWKRPRVQQQLSECAHLHLVPRETITRTLKYGKIFAISRVSIIESLSTNIVLKKKIKKKERKCDSRKKASRAEQKVS